MAQDTHFAGGAQKATPTAFKEKISGPVTKHHQLATGNTNGLENVQNAGSPSKRPMIANAGGKNW